MGKPYIPQPWSFPYSADTQLIAGQVVAGGMFYSPDKASMLF